MSNNVFEAHCHLEAALLCDAPRRLAVAAVKLSDSVQLESYRQHNKLAKIGLGIHPWYIDESIELTEYHRQLSAIIEAQQPNFIGECGLDFNKPQRELQILLCDLHCQIAIQYQLPIVFHCVRAYNELLQIIGKYPRLRGMVHGFNNNHEMAKQFIKKNMFLGIGSLITNEATQIYKSLPRIPLESILIESDSPYMPMHGKVYSTPEDCNEYVQFIANRQQKTRQDIICQVNANWLQLFGDN